MLKLKVTEAVKLIDEPKFNIKNKNHIFKKRGEMNFNNMIKRRDAGVSLITIIFFFVLTPTIFAVTFFSEDFNSVWSTTNPPTGWRISFTGDTSINDWHRKNAYQAPWSANSTPYACLIGSQTTGDSPDSLISSIIDCSNYYDIVLRCSTYFVTFAGSYRASLLGSIDGGLTWAYEIRSYYGQYVPPQLETFELPWAVNQPLLCFAWVFEGDPAGFGQWSLDNVSLTGSVIHDTDIATVKIRRPRNFELPAAIPLRAEFANVGRHTQVNVPVGCEIRHLPDSIIIHRVTDVIPILYPGDTSLHTFSTALLADTGNYIATAWCYGVGDQDRSNDTLRKTFTVGWKDEQGYDDGRRVGDSSWVWERFGWGVRFNPGFYPALVEKVKFHFSVSESLPNRFRIRICDDDGAGTIPKTPLYESGILIAQSGWNSYDLSLDSIVIWDSSFYIFFIQAEGNPLTPCLSYDAARNLQASYWTCYDTSYGQDFFDGDWMIRCVLNYSFEMPRPNPDDFRTVFIGSPEENILVRPPGRTFIPQARIENWGDQPQVNVPVVCSIISISNPAISPYVSIRIVDLNPSSDTILSFRNWSPTFREQGRITVRTLLANDMNPSNDAKVETIFVHRSCFIGQDSSVFDYRWIDSDTTGGPTYSWIDATPPYIWDPLLIGDDQTRWIPLDSSVGFPFRFYDTTFRGLWVSDNGWIRIGPDTGHAPPGYPNNSSIPHSRQPNNTIYVFWDDLIYGPEVGGGGIYFKRVDSAPNRKFVIIYNEVRRKGAGNSDPISFEVFLHENGIITLQYNDVFCSDARYNYGRSATVGIEDINGEYGLQYLYGEGGSYCYYPGNKLSQSRAIKIYSSVIGIERNYPSLIADQPYLKSYPNPFRNKTTIKYSMTKNGNLSLKIYDIGGRLVRNLLDGFQKSGVYTVNWNGSDDFGRKQSAGVYFYRLEREEGPAITKELILLR